MDALASSPGPAACPAAVSPPPQPLPLPPPPGAPPADVEPSAPSGRDDAAAADDGGGGPAPTAAAAAATAAAAAEALAAWAADRDAAVLPTAPDGDGPCWPWWALLSGGWKFSPDFSFHNRFFFGFFVQFCLSFGLWL